MKFESHDSKAASNLRNHEVSFEEASTVFFDPLYAVFPDEQHLWDEQRFNIIGQSSLNRLLFVVYTETDDSAVRLISARLAAATERKNYEEH